MKPIYLFGWLALFFLVSCHAKKVQDNFDTVNEGELVNKHFFFSMPYENSPGNAAVIPVVINGKSWRFMIDTGSPFVISKELQKELHLPNLANSSAEDSNGDSTGLNIVRISDLAIGELNFKNIPAIVLDLNGSSSACDPVDGFIGSNLLRLLVIQFNKPEQRIYFSSSVDSFRLAPGTAATGMSLNFEQSSPVIGVKLNSDITDSVLFDSGDGALYSISKKKFDSYNHDGSFNDHIIATGCGLPAQGVLEKKADSLPAFVLQLDSLSIGPAALKNMYVEPTHAGRSRVGRALWDYGTVTMDFPQKQFYFSPYQKNDSVKTSAGFGFKYLEKHGKLSVTVVWNNTPAFACGLRPGAEILQFGNFIPKSVTLCDWPAQLKKEAESSVITLKYLTATGEVKTCSLPKKMFGT